MADNTRLNKNETVGDEIRTDDIGGVKTQIVKLDLGVEGIEQIGSTSDSTGNTTTTPLTGSATFTGTGELNTFPDVMVSCTTDAAGTLFFDFSPDGTNWGPFPVAGFRVAAGIHEFHTAVKGARYFRVRLVNDSDAQTYLRLYTFYGTYRQSNAPLNQSIGLDTDAAAVRPTDFADEVRIGRRPGVDGWTKFGYRDGLTASAGFQTVWRASGNFTPQDTADTYTITYNSSTDGAGTTGALALYIQYIDAAGLPAVATHVLGNDGSDETAFTGLGINRAAVASSGSAQMNTNDITLAVTTGGAVNAFIAASESVTNQAIFHVGSNSDAVAKFLWINANKSSGGGTPVFEVRGRVYSRLVGTWYQIFNAIVDTGIEATISLNEPVGFNLGPQDVLVFDVDTSVNNSACHVRFSLTEYARN